MSTVSGALLPLELSSLLDAFRLIGPMQKHCADYVARCTGVIWCTNCA